MRRLTATAIVTATALLFGACETDLDLKQIEASGSRIYINAFCGDRDTTWVKVLKTIPVGAHGGNSKDLDITSLRFTVDGEEKTLTQGSDSIWYNVGDCRPGSAIAIEVKADGLDEVSAVSSIPGLPEVQLERDIVAYDESSCIRIRLKLEDDPEEEDFYGFSMTTNISQSQDGEYIGEYSNPTWFMYSLGGSDLEELAGSGSIMTYSYYDWISGHGDPWQTINFFSDKELRNGAIEFYTWYYPDIIDEEYTWFEDFDYETHEWTISTHIRTELRTYTARIFKLSPECYRHMRADYMKDNGGFAAFGLTAPNFAYSNVRNGYGVFCGLSMKEFELGNL